MKVHGEQLSGMELDDGLRGKVTVTDASGEAEVRSLTRCAPSCVSVKNLAQEDFGTKIDTPRVWCNSSAALQAAKRMLLLAVPGAYENHYGKLMRTKSSKHIDKAFRYC